MKENKETILQLSANMRISCLWLDLFQVREAMLETLCLCSYILIHMLRNKTIFSLSHTPLLQNFAITDTKSPPRLSVVMGVNPKGKSTKSKWCYF